MAVLWDEQVSYRRGSYFFAHAGIRPGVPLADQDAHDLVWIRQPFLSWPDPLEAVVVHGHTPKDAFRRCASTASASIPARFMAAS